MIAGRENRRPTAGRTLRAAAVSTSGTSSITAVALFCDTGILRQHGHGRISRANHSRVRSMKFSNRMANGRSSLALVEHSGEKALFSGSSASTNRAAAKAGKTLAGRSMSGPQAPFDRQIQPPPLRDRPQADAGALRKSSDVTLWQTVSMTVFLLMAQSAGAFVALGEAAFPRLLLTIMSWTLAQAFAGCLAYAEATYPFLLDQDEPADRRDPPDGPRSGRGDSNQLRIPTSGAGEISAHAKAGWRAPTSDQPSIENASQAVPVARHHGASGFCRSMTGRYRSFPLRN
jgi:hypothetical protein